MADPQWLSEEEIFDEGGRAQQEDDHHEEVSNGKSPVPYDVGVVEGDVRYLRFAPRFRVNALARKERAAGRQTAALPLDRQWGM